MGKHSRPEPKKISFLASTGGIFAAMALAGGLFVAGHVTGNNPFDRAEPPVNPSIEKPIQSPADMVATGTALSNLSDVQDGPTAVPTLPDAQNGPVVNVPPLEPQNPSRPPTLSPSPNPSPPDVGVGVDVDTPIVDLDTDLDLRVPLLGSAVDTVEETTDVVGDVVEGVTDPLTDLLGK